MRNISVRIILAVLLVASLGCAKVMNCKTEWFPTVKKLVPDFNWGGRISDIKDRPKHYLCAEIHYDDGRENYVAIEKNTHKGDLVYVTRPAERNTWELLYFIDMGKPGEMSSIKVDSYGIESYMSYPYKDYYKLRELLRNAIADDECPDSWKTNGVCDPAWYSWGRN